MSNYRDVQTAVRVEKLRIWFAWVTGGFIMLAIAPPLNCTQPSPATPPSDALDH
jgi:hypothetical protein